MDLLLLAVAAVLVNNFVLTQFLGLCPFMGVSRKVETAAGMAAATAFVLTLASVLSYLAFTYILVPLDAEYLRTPTFILIIAVAVQLTEMTVRFTSPMLQQVLGLYLPLITTNCAVLGVALLNLRGEHDLLASAVYGAAAAAGFGLVLVVFAALRERLESSAVPRPFRGAPIALVSAGILAMGFMGFAGLAQAGERELAVEREEMVEVEANTLALQEGGAAAPIVLLSELDGERAVPIFIGPLEAQAIDDALRGRTPPRPMTHDLFIRALETTGYTLRAAYIDAIRDGAFVAAVELEGPDGERTLIDSRASDAIALALRAEGATLYAAPQVLDSGEEMEPPGPGDEPLRMTRPQPDTSGTRLIHDFGMVPYSVCSARS